MTRHLSLVPPEPSPAEPKVIGDENLASRIAERITQHAGAERVIHDLVHGTGDEQPTVTPLGTRVRNYPVEDEPANEHVAQALQLLTNANYFSQRTEGPDTVVLSRDEYEAIRARLDKAIRLLSVAKLEGR